MHKLRIIIYVNPKIMINSLDVHFGITRQCAQVELKNIIIFIRKNHLGNTAGMEKNLFSKIYCITLCNFWHSI
jgi:hypothetical protein